MIILNNKKLIESKFTNEQEVEDLTILRHSPLSSTLKQFKTKKPYK